MPKLFWDGNDGDARYDSSGAIKGSSEKNSEKRAALVVPPELRAEIELPEANEVATQTDPALLPKKYTEAVAGKGVALDARAYPASADKVFSAVIDAMTSLNLPVESVDSRSGIVTPDWVRKGVNSSITTVLGGMVGLNKTPIKHRFVVRVFRMKVAGKVMSKLEIRVLLQSYIAKHWVNKPANRKISLELFAAVEEQLTRMKANAPLRAPIADRPASADAGLASPALPSVELPAQ